MSAAHSFPSKSTKLSNWVGKTKFYSQNALQYNEHIIFKYVSVNFQDAYNSLPQYVRDLTFYFRLETICAINFFVYYLGSPSTRKMLKKYLGAEVKKEFSTRKVSSTFQMSRIEN